MRVTLISLPTRSATPQIPNLGTIAIAQSVRDLGHEVHVVDVERYRYSTNQVIQEVERTTPDVIGLSGIITSYYFYEPLSKLLRLNFPNVPMVVGGSITSAADLIEKFSSVDYMVKGEGEDCIAALLGRLSTGETDHMNRIPGLFVRQGETFQSPNEVQSYPKLNGIPIPAYDLYDMEYYIDACTWIADNYLRLYPEIQKRTPKGTRFFPVVLTRGCPYACAFCYRLTKKFRHPTIEYAISYLKMAKEKFGCDGISLLDELTITNRRWFIELCDAIADEVPGLHIFFGAGKVNLVTPDVVHHARKAGFVRFGCGIESGSQAMLDSMNKMTTVEQNRRAILLAKEAGMMASCNIMFGNPGESRETIKETEKFIQDLLDPEDFSANFAVAYPGTPLFDHAINEGLLPEKDVRDYVLNTSWGDYPLNFSKFESGEEMVREVQSMLFRLKLRHAFKTGKFSPLLTHFKRLCRKKVIEWLRPLSPRAALVFRSLFDSRPQVELAIADQTAGRDDIAIDAPRKGAI